MKRRQDKVSYANAKSTLLTADIETRRFFENDDDWATFEKRYREKMLKGLNKAQQKLGSKSDQALFDMDAKLTIERGVTAIREAARKKEIDEKRANLDVILDEARKNALEADPATRSDILLNALDAITSMRGEGILTKEHAVNLGQAFTKDHAEASLTLMEPEARIEMLKHPEGTPAKFLHPDTRKKLLRAAEKENKATRVRGASQTATDQIMEDHPEDRGDALVAARKIKDPDVRAAAVTGVNARFNEMEAIERENVDSIYDAATEFIGETGSLAGFQERDLQKLSPSQQKSLDDFARYEQKGVEPVHSDEKYDEWLSKPIAEQGATNLLAK
ncbi:MAG: hypothetical protein IH987_11570 [Planctomycetes bacterium]|nr:hypothetical protein [Planctomycetota bacterium]